MAVGVPTVLGVHVVLIALMKLAAKQEREPALIPPHSVEEPVPAIVTRLNLATGHMVRPTVPGVAGRQLVVVSVKQLLSLVM